MTLKSEVSFAWEDFKRLAGIGDTLDYIAVLNILRSTVNGVSVYDISRVEDLPVDYVRDVIKEFLGDSGFEKGLDKSPLMLYNISINLLSVWFGDEAQKYIEMCEKFLEIERIVNEYYSG